MTPKHLLFAVWHHYLIPVPLNHSGTVSPTDYDILVGSSLISVMNGTAVVTTPAWQESVAVTVKAFDDTIVERLYETLTIGVTSAKNGNVNYACDTGVLNFKIKDNDTFTLEMVNYLGKLGMIPDPGLPAWQVNTDWVKGQPSKTDPVAYKSGDTVSCSASFSVTNGWIDSAIVNNLQVRFIAEDLPGSPESAWKSFDGYNVYDVFLTQTLADIYGVAQPDFIEASNLRWEFRVAGDPENRVITGKNANPFYVTRTQPYGTLYHTVVHVGCEAAKGQTTESGVFNAIWGKFENRSIHSVKVVNGVVVNNELLSYYGKASDDTNGAIKLKLAIESIGGVIQTPPLQLPSIARKSEVSTTVGLLTNADGICDAWAQFMVNVLDVQGIQTHLGSIYAYPQNSNDPNAFNVKSSVPGQGTASPRESIFVAHAVVGYDGEIYDPSYGLPYGTLSGALTQFMKSIENAGRREPSSSHGGNTQGYGYVYEAHTGPIVGSMFWLSCLGLEEEDE